MAILSALLGSWGKQGGLYLPEAKSVPKFPQPAYPHPKWSWEDLHEGKFPLATMGITTELLKGFYSKI